MGEASLVQDLLELSLDATRADVVEFVMHADAPERQSAVREGLHLGRIDIPIVEAAVVVSDCSAMTSSSLGAWVNSYVAVPIVGPSAEAGMLIAAGSHVQAFEETALKILQRVAAIIEHRLDRSLERMNLDELGLRLHETQSELQMTRDRLALSNQELEQFAYIAAHELVAPLRSVAVYAEVLGGSEGPQLSTVQRNDCVDEIRGGVQRMTQQVQYLLALSSSQTNVSETVAVPVGDVVQAALDTLAVPLDEVAAVVHVDDLPVVQASPIPLQSVFANLISNAVRYRNPDRQLKITIESVQTPVGSRIVVTDNGRGVEPPQQRRIFRLFERASTTEDGAGIGLAVSRRILDGFNATIGVDSGADGGSSFWIQFPPSTVSRTPSATD